MHEMETASSTGGLAPVFSNAPARSRVVCWLFALLPLFGQTFHYLSALPPLWALSKAFPVLSLPAVLALRGYPRFPKIGRAHV